MQFTRKLLPVHSTEEAMVYMTERIESGEPLMVARFGAVEIKAMLYVMLPWPLCQAFRKWALKDMEVNAGFFPLTKEYLKRFTNLMLDGIDKLDILASWRIEELFLRKRLAHTYKMSLGCMGPILPPPINNWPKALKNKKLLVISPFTDTIMKQYNQHRSEIFGDMTENVLPEFASLETVKAVQTIAGNRGEWSSWFEALEWMEREIDKKDFEIALIGCGAYGFPLAAYVKSLGKQAIHIGGPLQLYFGIRGKRWTDRGFYSNDVWTSPSESERPKNLENVEAGCYW